MGPCVPGSVKTRLSQGRAELFSLFSSFDCACQSGYFAIQRNRDKRSTRKLEVGVFTQPDTLTYSEPDTDNLLTIDAADPTGLLVATPVEGDPSRVTIREY